MEDTGSARKALNETLLNASAWYANNTGCYWMNSTGFFIFDEDMWVKLQSIRGSYSGIKIYRAPKSFVVRNGSLYGNISFNDQNMSCTRIEIPEPSYRNISGDVLPPHEEVVVVRKVCIKEWTDKNLTMGVPVIMEVASW